MNATRRGFLVVLGIAGFAAGPITAEELFIGSIDIRPENVFTLEEAGGHSAFEIANRLHVTTRESVIRKFLLFEEGDPYRPELLAETERNLRKLRFIKSATVRASDPHGGVVDVEVITQDSWSTEPDLSLGSRGGGTKASLDLKENNLFGTGRDLTIGYAYDPDRTRERIRLHDPAVFGAYWYGEVEYGSSSDGKDYAVSLERPFFSIETPWALRLSSTSIELEDRQYGRAEIIDRYIRSEDRTRIEASRALAADLDHAHRLSVGLDLSSKSFSLAEGSYDSTLLPEGREYRYLFARYDFLRNDYVKERYVDRDSLVEDFNLGTQFSIELALSPKTLGVEETTGYAGLSWARGFRAGQRSLFLASVSLHSRLGTPDRDQMSSGQIRWIHRLAAGRLPQTTLASLRIDAGQSLDRDHQLYGDGENGLRGYRLHAFSGEEREILNLEHRIFLGKELYRLVSPGAAFFVDTGSIVNGGERSTVTDVGVGLLFSISRSSRGLVRVDIAWALDADPLGRDGLLISVSSHHAF